MSQALQPVERDRLGELEAVIEHGRQTFVEVGGALLEIRRDRLYRESHSTFEAYCGDRWDFSDSRARQLIAAAETVTTVTAGGLPAPRNEAQARQLVPLLREDEAQVVDVWRELREKHGDDLTAVDVKRVVSNRVERIKRERVAAEPVSVPDVATTGNVEVRSGDLRTVFHDLDGQVDAIITDPPYPAEFLDEFDALGALAARLLKTGGIAAVMVGQTHLPEYLRRLDAHLTYRWCGAYLTEGPATRVFGRKVGTRWKPILIFGGTEFLTEDVFRSRGDDKQHHHWGQSESGMADLVERLTNPGDLIVDPFLGGGTTAIVCRELGRRFVGCDIDPLAVARTLRRLAA